MRYLYRDHEVDVEAPIGGKARALAGLRDVELPIPPWFVLCPDAFYASLSAVQRETLQSVEQGVDRKSVV